MLRFPLRFSLPLWGMLVAIVMPLAAAADMPDCEKPQKKVTVPDGVSASQDEMLEAKSAVETFVKAGQLYLNCVSEEISEVRAEAAETAGAQVENIEDAVSEAEQELVQLHDEMVTEMEAVASAFNQELREYNSQGE